MIWVIGGSGMLGKELTLCLSAQGLDFISSGHEIDITDVSRLEQFAESSKKFHPIKWIINCAAYTAVDKAEDDKILCRKINVNGPSNISLIAEKISARLIHISTDYVFNGQQSRPYLEDDATNPTGIYGLTKRDGEKEVLRNNEASYIIRTAWLYGRYGKNFVTTILRLMNEKNAISVVNDQKGSPTWSFDLAQCLIQLILFVEKGKKITYGIYHFTDEGNISWYDFAKEIYIQGKKLGLLTRECIVQPCSSEEFPSKVKRPAYSILDKTKIKKALGIDIPVWNVSLENYLKFFTSATGI
jgi:dTDP-4-dehydrorhamnose reductase